MKFAPLGRSYSTGKLLFDPVSENDLIAHRKIDVTSKGGTFRKFRGGPKPTIDYSNPKEAGWTFLMDNDYLQNTELVKILQKLAMHRIGKQADPLKFDIKSNISWDGWKNTEYDLLDIVPGKIKPYYILIVGGPDRIPFGLQSKLDVNAAVGRIFFDNIQDYQNYVDKIIRLESGSENAIKREITFFATNHGMVRDERDNMMLDPTHFSLNNMVNPMIEFTKTNPDIQQLVPNTVPLLGPNATKKKLETTLRGSKSALIFTASHGLGVPLEFSENDRKQLTGSICCQDSDSENKETMFCASDIPQDGAFLEGSVFFQFSCFGYGSPYESDFEHWFIDQPGWKKSTKIAEKDIISPIPKTLLAHTRGPIAFIGHLDVAILDGFYDEKTSPEVSWSPRLAPYQMTLKYLLGPQTVGHALNQMNARYSDLNATMNEFNNRIQKNQNVDPAEMATTMLQANDAKNFLLFGDPATYISLEWA